jgi:purine nucleosidase
MRMIIDTDAGIDDAEAIMLALSHPGVGIEVITTVTGNVHVEQATRNVFVVLDTLQRNVPVYQGAVRPLVAQWRHETEAFHGKDGLGDMPDRNESSRQALPGHAAETLVRLADENPGELTLVALGPLTNIALAVRLDPTFPQKIRNFTFMGGTTSARGNTEVITAEFNIYMDPEAAFIALEAFPRATMLSWETTLAHPLTWEQYNTLAAMPSSAGQFYRKFTRKVADFFQAPNRRSGYLLPDPLAMAVTLQPELITESAEHFVTVELNGTHTRGQTVIDYSSMTGNAANVRVVTGVNMAGVYDLYHKMLAG